MKKKVLSLALALAMCLGLTVPAFAANPKKENGCGVYFYISDVLREEEGFAWYDSYTYYLAPDATITITEGPLEADEYPWSSFYFLAESEHYFVHLDENILQFNKPYTYAELNRLAQENYKPTEEGEDWGKEDFSEFNLWVDYVTSAGSSGGIDMGHYKFETQTTPVQPEKPVAKAVDQNIEIDGKPVAFQTYMLPDANGYGTNYVKLRDIAHVLNGTNAQFAVGYNKQEGYITAEMRRAYKDTGTEMNTPFAGADKECVQSEITIIVDGCVSNLEAITLMDDSGNGYNYFKLRDLGDALGFKVGYSNARGVYVETK